MSKLRLKLLQRIAQAAETTATTPTTSVSGSPSDFNASSSFPGMVIGFTTRNSQFVDTIGNILNQAIYYSSGGQLDMAKLKSSNFNPSTSGSSDLNKLTGTAKALYNSLFTNNGQDYTKPLSQEEIKAAVDRVSADQNLQGLPSTNPTGQLATKISGNIKTLITSALSNIR